MFSYDKKKNVLECRPSSAKQHGGHQGPVDIWYIVLIKCIETRGKRRYNPAYIRVSAPKSFDDSCYRYNLIILVWIQVRTQPLARPPNCASAGRQEGRKARFRTEGVCIHSLDALVLSIVLLARRGVCVWPMALCFIPCTIISGTERLQCRDIH